MQGNNFCKLKADIHISVYICMYVCMHACMHLMMYVCMFDCMYAYTCPERWPFVEHVLQQLHACWLPAGSLHRASQQGRSLAWKEA